MSVALIKQPCLVYETKLKIELHTLEVLKEVRKLGQKLAEERYHYIYFIKDQGFLCAANALIRFNLEGFEDLEESESFCVKADILFSAKKVFKNRDLTCVFRRYEENTGKFFSTLSINNDVIFDSYEPEKKLTTTLNVFSKNWKEIEGVKDVPLYEITTKAGVYVNPVHFNLFRLVRGVLWLKYTDDSSPYIIVTSEYDLMLVPINKGESDDETK
ncbi:hypothetical protein [Geovibrio ferrireducens]|uniref:hypothetical protein n=1 Tax=Geovibrio ferrireducens TaxID=46201 RepID=UPI0022451656|nr:hypothetical protein [Geovibrio ferrireducens]